MSHCETPASEMPRLPGKATHLPETRLHFMLGYFGTTSFDVVAIGLL